MGTSDALCEYLLSFSRDCLQYRPPHWEQFRIERHCSSHHMSVIVRGICLVHKHSPVFYLPSRQNGQGNFPPNHCCRKAEANGNGLVQLPSPIDAMTETLSTKWQPDRLRRLANLVYDWIAESGNAHPAASQSVLKEVARRRPGCKNTSVNSGATIKFPVEEREMTAIEMLQKLMVAQVKAHHALGAAIEELALWAENNGGSDVASNVRDALNGLDVVISPHRGLLRAYRKGIVSGIDKPPSRKCSLTYSTQSRADQYEW